MKLCTDLGMDMGRMNSTRRCIVCAASSVLQVETLTLSSLFTSLWNLLMAESSLRAIWWKSC